MLAKNLNPKTKNQNSKVKTNLKGRCYLFSIKIIKFLESLPNRQIYWVISNQLLRSATSIGANIVEAKGSGSKKDFIRFYRIALKSAHETQYWLSLLKDTNLSDKRNTERLLMESIEITKITAASILTMTGKR